MRVLLVEDDAAIASLVARDLRACGYTVDAFEQARRARLHAALDVSYAALVIDLRLPDRDGLDLVRELRARGVAAPILILTGRRKVADRVAGLEAGADDYLVKPFALAELRARLTALRRRGGMVSDAPAFADIGFDGDGMEATVAGKPIRLSRQEARLLRLLVERGGHVLSKPHIEEALYGFGEEVASNSVEVHIHNLRSALRSAGAQAAIETRRGLGYSLQKRAS